MNTTIKWTKTSGGTRVIERDVWTGKPSKYVTSPSRYVGTGPISGDRYEITRVVGGWEMRSSGGGGYTISGKLAHAKSNAEYREENAGVRA